ncbi:hypothetical protein [Aurantivibrio plasticivorans]
MSTQIISRVFSRHAAVSVLMVAGLAAISQGAMANKSAYGDLLTKCGEEIRKQGYADATIKLGKKVKSGSSYKFWIDIIEQGQKRSEAATAYCEGNHRQAEIAKFEISK